MKSSFSLAKVWFALSLAALVFAYGVAVGKWEWFPYSFLNQAVDQARQVAGQAYGTDGDGAGWARMFPAVYDREGVRVVAPDSVQPGLTFITSQWKWKGTNEATLGAKLIDQGGATLHTWRIDSEDLFQDRLNITKVNKTTEIHGSYLFPNGDVLLLVTYVGAARVDACGDVKWLLQEHAHHSVSRDEDGSFWISGTAQERRKSSSRYPDGFTGIEKPVWLDQILHVSEDGAVLERINILDLLYSNDMQRYLIKALGSYPQSVLDDPVHLNDVEPLPTAIADEYPLFEAGDLLVSLRHPDLILVFDPDSMEVRWHSSLPFLKQHDPDFVGNGWVGVFDNNQDGTKRGSMLGGSRIVMVQPHTDSIHIPFPTKHSEPLYTATRGKWQRLENGNMLLTEARAGRAVEVAPDGSTVWEWIHKSTDDSRVPAVTKATRYDLTREDVASWSCSSIDSVSTAQNQQTAP